MSEPKTVLVKRVADQMELIDPNKVSNVHYPTVIETGFPPKYEEIASQLGPQHPWNVLCLDDKRVHQVTVKHIVTREAAIERNGDLFQKLQAARSVAEIVDDVPDILAMIPEDYLLLPAEVKLKLCDWFSEYKWIRFRLGWAKQGTPTRPVPADVDVTRLECLEAWHPSELGLGGKALGRDMQMLAVAMRDKGISGNVCPRGLEVEGCAKNLEEASVAADNMAVNSPELAESFEKEDKDMIKAMRLVTNNYDMSEGMDEKIRLVFCESAKHLAQTVAQTVLDRFNN